MVGAWLNTLWFVIKPLTCSITYPLFSVPYHIHTNNDLSISMTFNARYIRFQTRRQEINTLQEGKTFPNGQSYSISGYRDMANKYYKDWVDEHHKGDIWSSTDKESSDNEYEPDGAGGVKIKGEKMKSENDKTVKIEKTEDTEAEKPSRPPSPGSGGVDSKGNNGYYRNRCVSSSICLYMLICICLLGG